MFSKENFLFLFYWTIFTSFIIIYLIFILMNYLLDDWKIKNDLKTL